MDKKLEDSLSPIEEVKFDLSKSPDKNLKLRLEPVANKKDDNKYGFFEDQEDDQGEDFYSQQNYEIYAFVYDRLKVELEDYLKVDDQFKYIYKNPKIKTKRSLSANHAVKYKGDRIK